MRKTRLSGVLTITAALVLLLIFQSVYAQPPAGRRGDRERSVDPKEMLERMDENKDGKLSKDEYRGPDDRFKEIDTNSDGFLSEEELKNRPERTPEREERGPRRGFDPSQMQERMLSRIKETIGSSDEEWKAIEPLTKNVLDAQMKARMGGFFGRRGGPSDENTEADALRQAVESEQAKPEEIKQKLAAFRESRKKNEEELKKSREKLQKVLTVKQEAQLVLMGILE